MALFGFGKKKEVAACGCGCSANDTEDTKAECCPEICEGDICCIKVLGSGCKSCHALYENVKQAVKDLGLSVEVTYVTDMQEVMKYGVMSMPALVINEKVVSWGKVLKASEVVALLHKTGF